MLTTKAGSGAKALMVKVKVARVTELSRQTASEGWPAQTRGLATPVRCLNYSLSVFRSHRRSSGRWSGTRRLMFVTARFGCYVAGGLGGHG